MPALSLHPLLIVAAVVASIPDTSCRAGGNRAHAQVVLQGVVVDFNGRPVADVRTNAVFLSRRPVNHPLAGSTVASVVGRTTTDSRGSFQMRVRPTDPSLDIALELFGYVRGHGVGFQYLEAGKDHYQVTLRLPKETIIEGRLLGPNGGALPRAYVNLSSLRTTVKTADTSYPFHTPPADFGAWPQSGFTGQDGRFTLAGVSLNTEIELDLNDNRVARQRWTVTIGAHTPENLELQAAPPRTVEGTVVAAGSSVPITAARVVLSFKENNQFLGHAYTTTDDKGRFTLTCYKASQLQIRVTAAGTKYRKLSREISWIEGTTTQGMTLPLEHDGYRRVDGTTPDGQPASTIDVDYPLTEVIYRRPSNVLAAQLDGTLLFEGAVTARGTDTRIQGVFAIDLETGRWWNIAKDTTGFRVSPNGNYYAINSAKSGLRILASDLTSPAMQISNEIRNAGCRVASWMPSTDALIVSKATSKKRHYFGEEYWQLDSVKWHVNIADDTHEGLSLPPRYDVWDVSPDGELLAMQWDTHAHFTGAQLYVSNRDGSELRPLARKREQYYWYPRFSPDGKIVLAKHLDARKGKHGRLSLRTIAMDGSKEQSISVSDEFGAEIACWSPDGDYIAVAAYPNAAFLGGEKHSTIFIVDSEGSRIRNVALKNASKFKISTVEWSPLQLQSK